MPSPATKNETRYKRPESVLVVVYTGDGQVLLLRRREPSTFWQSVAGSLEWGESPRRAVARELREETGIEDRQAVDCRVTNRFLIYPMWRDRYAPGVVENTEYVFRLELDTACGITLDDREHVEYRWLSRREALMRVSSHTNFAAIERWVR